MSESEKKIASLEERVKLLTKLLDERTKLLSKTIHDMSTPLTVANFELQKIQATQENQEAFDRIEEALDKVTVIIEDYKVERERFALDDDVVKSSLKKTCDYIRFYLSKDIILNDIELETRGEDHVFLVEESSYYKVFIHPLFAEILASNANTTVKVSSLVENNMSGFLVNFENAFVSNRLDSYQQSLQKMNGKLEFLSPTEIKILLKCS
jgi:signal transduction histidine kinase